MNSLNIAHQINPERVASAILSNLIASRLAGGQAFANPDRLDLEVEDGSVVNVRVDSITVHSDGSFSILGNGLGMELTIRVPLTGVATLSGN